jgi:uncharacterized Zn finger protein
MLVNNDKKDYGEVIINGKRISSSWWGQMWCKNIENYSYLQNRLERGRTYIRKNTIKKLSIFSNCAESEVQGTQSKPYNVKIKIKKIDNNKYSNILEKCENTIDNLESLMTGSFPEEFQQFFTDEKYGLFPKIDEIEYECTCMDYKKNHHMCKHIAATFYAIGNKLDYEPLIFFKLRGINLDEFTKKIVKKENQFIWENINNDTTRKIDDNDISSLFGIEYDNDSEILDVKNILDINDEIKNKNEDIINKEKNEITDIETVVEIDQPSLKQSDIIDIFKNKEKELKNIMEEGVSLENEIETVEQTEIQSEIKDKELSNTLENNILSETQTNENNIYIEIEKIIENTYKKYGYKAYVLNQRSTSQENLKQYFKSKFNLSENQLNKILLKFNKYNKVYYQTLKNNRKNPKFEIASLIIIFLIVVFLKIIFK